MALTKSVDLVRKGFPLDGSFKVSTETKTSNGVVRFARESSSPLIALYMSLGRYVCHRSLHVPVSGSLPPSHLCPDALFAVPFH